MASFCRVLSCIVNQPSFTAPVIDMTGKTVVITGPTIGGIGFETAKALATFGASIVLAARNTATASEAAAQIRHAASSTSVQFLQCDVSQLESVAAFAEGLATLAPDGIDVLVCNAGATCRQSQKNAEGVEMTFAVCALGHHKLVHLTRPKRLVWVTGESYVLSKGMPDPFENVTGEPAYYKACLARLLLAREWKKQMSREGTPMEVVAVHPGVINSDFFKLGGLLKRIASAVLISAEQGAQASIMTASAPSAEIHQEQVLPYYHNKIGWVDLHHSDPAMDGTAAQKLFEKCDEICGICRT